MDLVEHLAALRREGDLLAEAVARTDLETPIPTCPEWRMRDLVRHMGDVHRWAAAHVAERSTEPIGKAELAEVAGPLPEDARLLEWFRKGHARLLHTLETAGQDTQAWTFLPAPSPVAFWARRQAHELVWLDEGIEVRREHGDADCTVRGPASDLHLLLWNRRTPNGLEVHGDTSLLDFWRETVQVRWSRSR